MASGPLAGVKILDLSHVWAGPLSTRILSDLGADIVKIERPYGRGLREPLGEPIGGWIGGVPGDEPWNRNAAFVKLARNSRSLCLDLKSSKGRDIFLSLVGMTDVVIENFSSRAMPSLGLAYEDLIVANPNIIYLTMPGFGSSGPYKDWVAFGPIIEPMSGLTNVMGYSREEPRNSGVALVDPIAATSAAAAIVTAIRDKKESGLGGQRVEMSLHEAGIAFQGPWLLDHQLGNELPPLGNEHPEMTPHGVYPCLGDDQWVAVACECQSDWQLLSGIDERLDPTWSLTERKARVEAIELVLIEWTQQRDKEKAAEELQSFGVAAGPVNSAPDMLNDSHVVARGFFVPLEAGDTPMPGSPIKMQGVDPEDWTPCPTLGEHNYEILNTWLGYSEDQVLELYQEEVIADRPPA